MRSILLRYVLPVAGLAVAWLFVGRHLTLLIDRFFTVRIRSLPVSPITYEYGSLHIGEQSLEMNRPFPAGKSFALAQESGDVVDLSLDRSLLSWPTPLDFNFITGHSPSWKRHLYYRLVWKKASGARLRMTWRYEQWYYPGMGWGGIGGMTRANSTGLIQLEIDSQ